MVMPGGVIVLVNKLEILAPWLGLAGVGRLAAFLGSRKETKPIMKNK
jgi:hypothetical protein